jgi:hypothetical protein
MGPRASVQFLTWGRPDFVLRAATIVLTEPSPIRGSNSRLRTDLARNCDGRIFEFFNSIGQLRPFGVDAQISGARPFAQVIVQFASKGN